MSLILSCSALSIPAVSATEEASAPTEPIAYTEEVTQAEEQKTEPPTETADTTEPVEATEPAEASSPTETEEDEETEEDDEEIEPPSEEHPPVSEDPYTTDTDSDPSYTILKININEKTPSPVVRANIQSAFDLAHEKATVEHQYKIILPKGTYKIDTTLSIYSNTYFEMNGAVLVRDFSDSFSMLKAGKKDYITVKYEGYGNITLHNGVFDGWDNEMKASSSNLVRFGHARNILIDSVTFTDNTSSHHLELGACKDVTIKDCCFKDQHRKSGDSSEHESIQIDALDQNCFPLYESYDGTACRDITIEGCTFTNVTRGIGSHSVILDENGMFDGIRIINNSFSDIDGYTIAGLCWTNSQISGNTLSNCKNGILIRSMRKDLKGIYEGQFKAPHTGFNVVIDNNTISTAGLGIKILGCNVTEPVNWTTENTKETHTIPKGDFRIDGVTVAQNIINAGTTAIGLYRTDKSIVTDNKVTYPQESAELIAVQLADSSTDVLVEKNTVVSYSQTGNKTAVSNSGGSCQNTFLQNHISGSFATGIQVSGSSNGCTVEDNTITNSTSNAIYAADSKELTVNANDIIADHGNGINVKSGSEAIAVDNNKVTANDGHGIILNSSTSKEISGNTVESTGCGIYTIDGITETVCSNSVNNSNYGIYAKNSSIDALDRNTTEYDGTYGIVLKNSQLKTANENNVSHSESHGFCSLASSGEVYGNTGNYSGKYGMYFDNNSTNRIFINNFSNNISGDIYLAGTSNSKVTNLGMPTEFTGKNVSYNKNTLSWNEVRGTSEYRIFRGTDGVNFIEYDSVKTTSYNDTKITAGTRYYYKVQPIARMEKSTVYGAYSNILSLTSDGLGKAEKLKAERDYFEKITLSWENSVTPQYYNIYRRTDGDYILLMSVNGSQTSFADDNFVPDTTYTYKVLPVTYHGEEPAYGDDSNEVSVKTTVQNGELLSAKAVSDKKASISIKHLNGNSGYAVYTSTKKTGGYKLLGHISAAQVQKGYSPSLPDNTRYIKIKGYRTSANVRYYSKASKAVEIEIPKSDTPKIATLDSVKTKIKLTWKKTKNTTGYQVCISTDNKKWKTLTYTDKKSFKAENLKKNTRYYFKLRSFNTFCNKKYCSEYSKVRTIKTKADEKKKTEKTQTASKKKN